LSISYDTLTISLFDSRTETADESLVRPQVIISLSILSFILLPVFRLTCLYVTHNKRKESRASAVADIDIVST
jgi:hypothetical protein